ncbi:MAG: hypothetical protein KatS3mg002_1106 [Candidatus Woesearchaeota archaeon]|nr:MAG: hypothetical protein KatS3mg002_1106 [Candidatus Woesearchaeota archaeon]
MIVKFAMTMKEKINNIRNKKAIFYMMTVIVLLGIIMLIFYTYKSHSIRDKQDSLEIRVRAMNDFITDFNNDIHRSTRISATRSLIALEDYVSTSGRYFRNISEFNDYFREVFYYGTINGTNHSLMEDSSFIDYERKVFANAKNTGFNFYINVTKIELYQEDPWNVKVKIDAFVKLNDTSKVAYWEFNNSYITVVPIEGLRDPIYSINTLGRVQNTIRRSNLPFFVNGTDLSNLLSHINTGYYIESNNAPSFLMRFYNNLSSSEQGIESIVNINDLYDQGLTIYNSRPVIDYKYFSGYYNANVCNIQGLPAWFKIQDSDISVYQISGLNYTSC